MFALHLMEWEDYSIKAVSPSTARISGHYRTVWGLEIPVFVLFLHCLLTVFFIYTYTIGFSCRYFQKENIIRIKLQFHVQNVSILKAKHLVRSSIFQSWTVLLLQILSLVRDIVVCTRLNHYSQNYRTTINITK